MSKIDLAERIHDHNYRLDPYVRSLLDTDFYKLLMAFFIWKKYPDVGVSFKVKNRSVKKFRFSEHITETELRAQLDYVKGLSFTNSELIWLQGNTFYGTTGIFPGDFINALRNLRLPNYTITRDENDEFSITFSGTWFEVTMWEIYALSILNEAKSRAGMRGMSRYQLRVLYANATAKLVSKLKELKEAGVPRISEFGTRRRHGFLWQEFVIEAMREELGDNFIGTSNALHAMRMGIEAIGTNAHELPMVVSALARIRHPEDKHGLFMSQYDVLSEWQKIYKGNLLVALPDTFGTTQFLNNAQKNFPEIRDWRGFRLDSKDPFIGGEEIIRFWESIGVNPKEKLMLFSDGLSHEKMIALHEKFGGRCVDGYGWGTLATNDFKGCDPRGGDELDPVSVVCKVHTVMDGGKGVSAVKLSDNYEKATGEENAIRAYREVFGTEGVADVPVEV